MDRTQDSVSDKILEFCHKPRSKKEIMEYCGYKNSKKFTKNYLRPLLDNNMLQMTIPDKPTNRNQKYINSNIR